MPLWVSAGQRRKERKKEKKTCEMQIARDVCGKFEDEILLLQEEE
jgi:hypothetical protein